MTARKRTKTTKKTMTRRLGYQTATWAVRVRTKYLVAKFMAVVKTVAPRPMVWAALAWPQWSAFNILSPAALVQETPIPEEVAVKAASDQVAPQVQEQEVQTVIQRIVVLPPYVYQTEYVYVMPEATSPRHPPPRPLAPPIPAARRRSLILEQPRQWTHHPAPEAD